MKGGKPVVNPFGFTILEVMIVLVVTLIIFASAILSISGRTQTAEFQQAVNDLQSRLQAIMNDVSTGNFNAQGVSCTASNGILTFSSAPATDNGQCIFLGDALLFTKGDNFYTFEVFGEREDGINNSTNLSTDYKSAQPTIPGRIVSLVSSNSLNNELQATAMNYMPTAGAAFSTGSPTDMVAFLDDVSDSGTTDSGAIGVNVIPLENPSGLKQDPGSTTAALTYAGPLVNPSLSNLTSLAARADADKNPAGGVGICFQSQSTDQSVLYTLGGSGRNTAVENQIYDGATCS